MSNIIDTYALDFNECVDLLVATGSTVTTLFEGDMGIGKSSTLTTLAKRLPTHTPCYFDCTTKDLGDITIPNVAKLDDGEAFVEYVLNEELGAHISGPIILMLDEYGKANPAVRLALTRLMLERKIGSRTLHPDSIVYATTNLGAEGVGDMLKAHERNRVSVVRMAKPSADMWIEYGINAGVNPSVLGWVKDNPQVMQSFTEVTDPADNPYIFHPADKSRTAFVTPRSLVQYSKVLEHRATLGDKIVTAQGIGLIGARAALDMAAYIKLGDKLPTRQQIIDDPQGAPVPDDVAAQCMVVFRALSSMTRDFVDPFMEYLVRMPFEAQGLFLNGVRAPRYAHASIVFTNPRFTQWCGDNNDLFVAT